MTRKIRQLLGALLIMLFVIVYALTIMVIGETSRVRELGQPWKTLFFLVAGLVWVLPLLPLVRWMQKPDAGEAPLPRG